MAHILDGDWRSFIVRTGSPENDGGFHIEVDPLTNNLEPRSRHDGRPITGAVGLGSVFHAIRIIEESENLEYRGILIVNGATMIFCGFQNLGASALESLIKRAEKNPEEKAKLFDQIQEVWVATKP